MMFLISQIQVRSFHPFVFRVNSAPKDQEGCADGEPPFSLRAALPAASRWFRPAIFTPPRRRLAGQITGVGIF